MNLVKLQDGSIINMSHVVRIEQGRADNGAFVYLLGLSNPIIISQDDYASLQQIAEYSEAKLVIDASNMSMMTTEKSLKLFTELMLHFVAHNLAVSQGTTATYPYQGVYERIANVLNELNSVNESVEETEESDEESNDD